MLAITKHIHLFYYLFRLLVFLVLFFLGSEHYFLFLPSPAPPLLSDIHSIPENLRVVLERCLSEEPSPAVLETFMPEVRQVLFNLLRGLQKRQESWQMATKRLHHSSDLQQ